MDHHPLGDVELIAVGPQLTPVGEHARVREVFTGEIHGSPPYETVTESARARIRMKSTAVVVTVSWM
ncbi:hypothetical protein D3C78_1749140 [compost metagenome]